MAALYMLSVAIMNIEQATARTPAIIYLVPVAIHTVDTGGRVGYMRQKCELHASSKCQ